MRQEWKQNIMPTVVVTLFLWTGLFVFHVLYTVPHQIWLEANKLTPVGPHYTAGPGLHPIVTAIPTHAVIQTAPTHPGKADAIIVIANPKKPFVWLGNSESSKEVLREIRYEIAAFDLDHPPARGSYYPAIPATLQSFKDFWMRPGGGIAPWPMFQESANLAIGIRVFGYIHATCAECLRDRLYVFKLSYGISGWYGQMPDDLSTKWLTYLLFKMNREQQEEQIGDLPVEKKIPIEKLPGAID